MVAYFDWKYKQSLTSLTRFKEKIFSEVLELIKNAILQDFLLRSRGFKLSIA